MSKSSANHVRFLTPEEMPLWDELVKASVQGSVFCYSWWLQATCGEPKVLGLFKGDRLEAGIPVFIKKRWFITACLMPKLTQTWGVIMAPMPGKKVTRASRQTAICQAFARKLRRYPIFQQTFSPRFQTWLPFYWQGYKEKGGVTYVLDDLTDPERILADMHQNTRNLIKKAQNQNIQVAPCGIDDLLEMSRKSFERQGDQLHYPEKILRAIHEQACAREAGACFAARDQDGRMHGAAFLVWDHHRAYYLVGGGDPGLRSSGASSLLLWHMILFAAQRSQVFDFEGSMVPGIEHSFRSFGARQEHLHLIYRLPLLAEFAYLAKERLIRRKREEG
ncbi:MAG: GNAT family N-acetyltransferase [Proteobacteria bacterium]|nr:GNAT family N-acetyltransferase [Pseudomonadota bacterium]MBU4384645.1 GNAT family N-acetyltransferase [Pseudomonadota bacterium]MCG2766207.1 GNAT family N-acetyltransferase [Desulfarculaceae bacterium]